VTIIGAVAAVDEIRTIVRAGWAGRVGPGEPLTGGMNSQAFALDYDGRRCVAKLVPAERRRAFEAGLAAAERLSAGGIPAGAPVRAADGALTAVVGEVAVALLEFVPGRPLDRADPLDQQWWGDALGAAHRVLAEFHHPALTRFHWVRPDAVHLGVADWIRPAVGAAVDDLGRLLVTDQLSYGVLHGDPAPDAFLLDIDTGRIGLIDWGSTASGPLMYDIASAVMYAGGPDAATELIDGYVSAGPVPADEVEAALPTMLRFRWAVQADYFAWRIWIDDRTGVADPAENHVGLAHARAALVGD
jgi:Ser/Thr protein kinase RdoA (MazF antagonist)